ncbi:MAG: class I SAM-dependent methyltransferase [Desulfobulbaceae bacterium]|nr:class I SAM-dependent methyltransferase [Desulfobulbaceae bacterium]
MDYTRELTRILDQLGPERIRRSVYDNDNQLLAQGIADDRDGTLGDFDSVSFLGKTVVDLGCNLGNYSIFASQSGAECVLGIDLDKLVLQGSELLRDMQNVSNVDYVCLDFTSVSFDQRFDITMLIDFIGKGIISQGLNRFLDATEKVTKETMLISARNHYRIEKYFNGDFDSLIELYSAEYIRDGRFYLVDYITDYFKKKWKPTILSKPSHHLGSKKTLCFQRI